MDGRVKAGVLLTYFAAKMAHSKKYKFFDFLRNKLRSELRKSHGALSVGRNSVDAYAMVGIGTSD